MASRIVKSATFNRSKLFAKLLANKVTGLVYLQGGITESRRWTDVEAYFRQESYFFYLTGVAEPGCHLVMNPQTQQTTLFIPKHPADHAMWCGSPMTLKEAKETYIMDEVLYEDELSAMLVNQPIHVINDTTLPTTSTFVLHTPTTHILKDLLDACRIIKSEYELDFMREAATISSQAHTNLMLSISNLPTELHAHAQLIGDCHREGGVVQAYTPIIAGGTRGAVLHYIANNHRFEEDALVLVDAGCEVECYASDITRTFPVSGVFSEAQRAVYEIVLASQLAAGVEWEAMHRLATSVICDGLMRIGLLIGTKEALIENHVTAVFFPHGLGHMLGLEVHDVGGYPKGVERFTEPSLKYLRMRRTLEANMVVTVEPGVYFIDAIIDAAVTDPTIKKFINLDVLAKLRHVGGIRIEDDCVVKDTTPCEVLSKHVVKTVNEIEALMRK